MHHPYTWHPDKSLEHHRSGSHSSIEGGRAWLQWRGMMLPGGGSLWSLVLNRNIIVFPKMLKKRVVRVPNCEVKKKVCWGGNQGIFWRVKRVKRWSAGGFSSDFFSVLRVCPKFSTYIVWHCSLLLISCTRVSDWKNTTLFFAGFCFIFSESLEIFGFIFAVDVEQEIFFLFRFMRLKFVYVERKSN